MTHDASDIIPFSALGLNLDVLRTLDEVGYETPTPIQAHTIPLILAGRDVLGQAQTGTGKTAAFALPLLSRLDLARMETQVLVLAPTRELAIQVAEAFQVYAAHLKGFHVLPIYGGQGYESQLRQLKRGVHVVVGTPGRVMDHMRRGTLNLSKLSALVLDEADEMLRMGFIDDVEWILEQTPKERQVALFSATMPSVIRRIAQQHLRNPEEVTIKVRTVTAETITQRYWTVKSFHKLEALTRILEAEAFDGMIVFVRTKTATVALAEKLEARGFAAAPLNGDIAQASRERTVERLKAGKLDILVATDVAARGLDVDRISHVINYDVPHDSEAYIHRIGRTGRAGRSGVAILFVEPRETRMLRTIEKVTKQPIERLELPSTEEINDIRVARFTQKITDTLESEELGFWRHLMENYQQEHNIPALDIAAALARLIQGDEPLMLKDMPEPERSSRPEREPRQPVRSGPRLTDNELESYRIEVGRAHGVQPGNIVGAVANEAGIGSNMIGRINIFDDYSTIDLPLGMPNETLQLLKKVRVAGQPLQMSKLSGSQSGGSRFSEGPRDFPKRKSEAGGLKRDKNFKKQRALFPKKKKKKV